MPFGERRRIRIRYRSRSQPEPAPRVLDPYKLVSRWGWQYCIGYRHLRQGVRTFRLDRILDLEVLEQTFAEPVDFNLQEYLAKRSILPALGAARLRFGPEAALAALNNRAYWESSRSSRMARWWSPLPRPTWRRRLAWSCGSASQR